MSGFNEDPYDEEMCVERMSWPSWNMTRVGSRRPSALDRARLTPSPLLTRMLIRPTPIIPCKPSTTDSHAGAYSTQFQSSSRYTITSQSPALSLAHDSMVAASTSTASLARTLEPLASLPLLDAARTRSYLNSAMRDHRALHRARWGAYCWRRAGSDSTSYALATSEKS